MKVACVRYPHGKVTFPFVIHRLSAGGTLRLHECPVPTHIYPLAVHPPIMLAWNDHYNCCLQNKCSPVLSFLTCYLIFFCDEELPPSPPWAHGFLFTQRVITHYSWCSFWCSNGPNLGQWGLLPASRVPFDGFPYVFEPFANVWDGKKFRVHLVLHLPQSWRSLPPGDLFLQWRMIVRNQALGSRRAHPHSDTTESRPSWWTEAGDIFLK